MAEPSFRQASYEEIAQALRSHDGFTVCGHVNPDGDCIGSVLGCAHLLRALGKEVQPIAALKDPLDPSLASIPGADAIVRAEDARPMPVFITVDATADERLGETAAALRAQASFQIVLDHHEVRSCGADLCRIEPEAASATCLVWDLARAAEVPLTEDLASCCYTGLMTDTGRFQYQNADARAFRSAAEMVACGIDVSLISQEFFQNKTVAALRAEALAVERMEFLDGGDAVLSWISREDLQRLDARRDDCEGIINALRSIGRVHVACVLKEYDEGLVRGSFRSKDGTDVAALAARFGGGGHKAAAGFTLECSLDEALCQVREALFSLKDARSQP